MRTITNWNTLQRLRKAIADHEGINPVYVWVTGARVLKYSENHTAQVETRLHGTWYVSLTTGETSRMEKGLSVEEYMEDYMARYWDDFARLSDAIQRANEGEK